VFDWYKGMADASPNEAATIGRVKGFEYLVKYMEHRRWDMKHASQEYQLRYLGDWFILKLRYADLGLEEIRYGQGDLRLKKEVKDGINISVGLKHRQHPVYGFDAMVLDTTWYRGSWWDFAEDAFGVDDNMWADATHLDEDGNWNPLTISVF
jgi:hypothetical protein